jgi:hypothetical protein
MATTFFRIARCSKILTLFMAWQNKTIMTGIPFWVEGVNMFRDYLEIHRRSSRADTLPFLPWKYEWKEVIERQYAAACLTVVDSIIVSPVSSLDRRSISLPFHQEVNVFRDYLEIHRKSSSADTLPSPPPFKRRGLNPGIKSRRWRLLPHRTVPQCPR